jgi:pyruvate/2-oxoglutarate dehydrogenase complex dihydrolipoamide dehydrogenase (E3) component
VAEALTADGIRIRTDASVRSVAHDGSTFTMTLEGETLTADRLLVATGRRADLASLGLDAAGIDGSGRFLEVDEHLRVADGIWAVGDITGRGAFTHVAMYQSAIAVRSILGADGPPAGYAALPRVTFTDPEIGAVGRTEQQARDAGVRVRTSCVPLAGSTAAGSTGQATPGSSSWSRTRTAACSSARPGAGPSGGEVLGALSVRCMRRCRSRRSGG